ncbi:molybdopterin cofactor-binding domain-containing protein [Pseudonocardia sp. NPDC049154]|uniref:molybdopterin cofactor-binding domain-containing protein n=1 Tax=Pseudonocardia sp. NPDC049154 TaxID=3155501 RepID=UPI0033E4C2AE
MGAGHARLHGRDRPDDQAGRIPRYVAEDCGEIINPAVVDGQTRGGSPWASAPLYEHARYGEDGQFQAGTFMDFLIPTATETPDIEVHHVETPSTLTADIRGVGEGGMICSPSAISSAIEDVPSGHGVRVREQYLPPTRILELRGVIAAAGP